jgi:hypothetical protein
MASSEAASEEVDFISLHFPLHMPTIAEQNDAFRRRGTQGKTACPMTFSYGYGTIRLWQSLQNISPLT